MRPTAIFANNDYAAVIAMSEAQQMGLAIPDDISVVGYDNSYLARLGYIGLTTIDNNYVEMGRLAVLRLVERINAPNAPQNHRSARPVARFTFYAATTPSVRPCRTQSVLDRRFRVGAAAPVLRAAPEGKGVCPHSLQRLRSTPGG